MNMNPFDPPKNFPEIKEIASDSESDQISKNIAAVMEFYASEEKKITPSQRTLEKISLFIGQPIFLAIIFMFVGLWVLANAMLKQYGMAEFDPAPYFWLQGLISFSGLLIATVVLSKQNRISKLAEQRAHLDLNVTLLTEQKAAKLIDLLEELRRDMPNVPNRHDPDAAELKQSMNPELVLAALVERADPQSTTDSKEE